MREFPFDQVCSLIASSLDKYEVHWTTDHIGNCLMFVDLDAPLMEGFIAVVQDDSRVFEWKYFKRFVEELEQRYRVSHNLVARSMRRG